MKKFLYRTMLGFLITQQYGTTLLRADFEDTATPTEEENILNEEVSDEKSIDEDIILDKDTALVSESLLDLISDTIQSSVASEGDISNTETEEANISTPSHEAIEWEYVEGEVLVKYKDGTHTLGNSRMRILTLTEETYITLETLSIGGDTLAVIEGKNGESTEELIDLLLQDPNVEYVQPNFLYHTFAFTTNDPDYPNNLRGLGNIKRSETMEVFSGRANTTGSIVAVIDLGVDYRHPEFTGQMWNGNSCKTSTGAAWNGCQYGASIFLSGAFYSGGTLRGYQTTNKNPLPIDTARNPNNTAETLTNLAQYNTHWTHIAGTIWAKMNNGIGIVGVNPNSEIMAIKAGYNTSSDEFLTTNAIINSIAFARYNGAKIINASRGGGGIGDNALSGAIRDFTNAGGIFITAAGNAGTDNTSSAIYPCNFKQSNPGIICVAAHDSSDTLASFSNYGNIVDISAPGVNIKSTIGSGSYTNMQGTSMATPHVVGAFSLLWSYRPDLTGGQIKDALFNGADTTLLPYWGRTIAGNKKLNLYHSLQLLDTIIPILTGTVDTGEYCSTEKLIYTFTGSDDLALAEEGLRYSLDNGTTRTGTTTLTTGATSLTIWVQDRVGNTGSLTITANTPNCPTLLTPTFTLPAYVSGSAVNGVLTLNLQAEYTISGDITEVLTGEGSGNITIPLSLSGSDGLKTITRSVWTGSKSFSGEVKIFLDTTAPILSVSYSTTSSTQGSVQATLTLNETWTLAGWNTSNNRVFTKSYSANTTETVTAYDLAGNKTTTGIAITWITQAQNWWGGGGWGGGGWGGSSLTKDSCPKGDYSGDLYDEECGTPPQITTGSINTGEKEEIFEKPITTEATTTKPATSSPTAPDTSRATSIQRTTYGRELLQAYTYARDIGITTIQNVDQANLNGNLTRAQASKMLSQFAIQVLDRKPDTTKTCQYWDMAGHGDLTDWMKTSCQLGIMGIGTNTFNPNGEMTRAEFGTVLSRAIWGTTYNTNQGEYYTSHLQQLKKFWVMNNISSPQDKEIRGYVMLMLMRTANLLNT